MTALDRPSATKDGRWLGRTGAVIQIAGGVILGGLATGLGAGTEPGFLPRGIVLILVFGVPGVVGLIGAQRRRPGLLIAASLTSFAGAFVAFSGVTLLFLLPAFLLGAGAVALEAGRPAGDRPTIRGAVLGLAAAVLLVPLLVGGGAAALLITDQACWSAYGPAIVARYELTPFVMGVEMSIAPGATSSGCSTGLISARGVGLASVLWVAALALALRVSRHRGPRPRGQRPEPALPA